MKILSVNAGSSSLKFQAYEMPEKKELIYGYFERIGSKESFYNITIDGNKTKKVFAVNTHLEAVELLVKELFEHKIIEDLNEIKSIAHRVVHGGSEYTSSVVIDDNVMNTIKDLISLAPLHNPANITGIEAFQELIPNATAVAVFDTAFHQTMEPSAYIYAVPYEWYESYGVRKYGFHGISYQYLSKRITELTNKKEGNYIICHLGNGASISAVKNGKCVDTSMGFTPNAGVVMGTRCGDIDSTIIPYIVDKTGKSLDEVMDDLTKKSGLLGISKMSNDSRDIIDAKKEGNSQAILTDEIYNRKVVDYIAKYYVLLGSVDAIIFSAGVGENSIESRESIMNMLAPLEVKLDKEKNNSRGKETIISSDDSKIDCYVIPTDEELMMAIDAYKFVE